MPRIFQGSTNASYNTVFFTIGDYTSTTGIQPIVIYSKKFRGIQDLKVANSLVKLKFTASASTRDKNYKTTKCTMMLHSMNIRML